MGRLEYDLFMTVNAIRLVDCRFHKSRLNVSPAHHWIDNHSNHV